MSENEIRKLELHNATNNLCNTNDVDPLRHYVACNTVHGLGQDVERAGEKTQDAANAVKKKV